MSVKAMRFPPKAYNKDLESAEVCTNFVLLLVLAPEIDCRERSFVGDNMKLFFICAAELPVCCISLF